MKPAHRVLLVVAASAQLLWAPRLALAQPPAVARQEMVVAANPHAAEAALEILHEGGGALDAAIAAQLVLSLVEPQSSGIGGGAFMLFYDAPEQPGPRGKITLYEGRETAPAAATPDMFLDQSGDERSFLSAGFGGLPVGVPGVMRMFEMAHADQGRLPWAKLFEPAIALAEEGFEISPRLYFLLDRYERVARAEGFRRHFYDENGKARPAGYLLKNPDYAATLRLLAREGAEAMYSGPLAREIVARVRNNAIAAGRMTLADLGAYRAHESAPQCLNYRVWLVCGPKLPSSGGVTTQEILGILARFDLAATKDDRVEGIHLVADASRLAFADRNHYLGDPAFVDAPVAALLAPGYLSARAALIDPRKALESVAPGIPAGLAAWDYASSPLNDLTSTSHFSITDRWGDAVSMTTSVQGAFGSQLMVGGFILNNQLTDFAFQPEADGRPVANRVEGGKRPLSSMAPTIVLDADGRPKLIVGSPGGTRIINYVTQVIVAVLDWDMNIQEAVSSPHFLAQDGPIELEERTELLELAHALEALGHHTVERNLNSGLHGLAFEYDSSGRTIYGGVDPRREGVALGD
jgi:gamma-glutamyltranspeptidase / glutathione hydrolase